MIRESQTFCCTVGELRALAKATQGRHRGLEVMISERYSDALGRTLEVEYPNLGDVATVVV